MTARQQVKDVHRITKEWMERALGEVGATQANLEQRHLDALALILTAHTPAEAAEYARKARDKLEMYLYRLWGKRKIPGKLSVQGLEARARGLEGLASYQEGQGKDEAAERLRKKAEEARERAATLPNAPPPAPVPIKVPRKKRAS